MAFSSIICAGIIRDNWLGLDGFHVETPLLGWSKIAKPGTTANRTRPLTNQYWRYIMAKTDLTAQRLREILNYDPETGQFSWKQPAQGRSSKKIGTKDPGGYLQISVERCVYQAHRLAWLYFYGQWPAAVIDHINRCRTDNRIANLQDVPHRENLRLHWARVRQQKQLVAA